MQYKDEEVAKYDGTSDFDFIARTDVITSHITNIYSLLHDFFKQSTDPEVVAKLLKALLACSTLCIKNGIDFLIDVEFIFKIVEYYKKTDNEYINLLISTCLINIAGANSSAIDYIIKTDFVEIILQQLFDPHSSEATKCNALSFLTNVIINCDDIEDKIPIDQIYSLFDDIVPQLFDINKYQECAFYFTKSVYDLLDRMEIEEALKSRLLEIIYDVLSRHDIINSLCANHQFHFLYIVCRRKPEICYNIFGSVCNVMVQILNHCYEIIPFYFQGCLEFIVEFLQNPNADKTLYQNFLNALDYEALIFNNEKDISLTPEITTILEHGLRCKNQQCKEIVTSPSYYFSIIDDIKLSTNNFKLPVFKILIQLLEQNNDETCEYLLDCNFFDTVPIISENPKFAYYELVLIRAVILFSLQNDKDDVIPEDIIDLLESSIGELNFENTESEDKIMQIYEEIRSILNS